MDMSEICFKLILENSAVVWVNGEYLGQVASSIDFCTESKQNYIFLIFDTDSTQVMVVKVSKHNNILFCENEYAKLFHQKNNKWLMWIKSHPTLVATAPLYLQKEDLVLTYYADTILIQNAKNSLCYTPRDKLADLRLNKTDNISILGKVNMRDYILILNENLQILYEKTADQIEYKGQKIMTLDNINDIARHGLVTIFEYKNNHFEQTEQYTVYTQDTPIYPANEYALPIAFLQAISLKNFTLARTYLHPLLAQNLTDNNIKAYFGDFAEILPNTDNNLLKLALIYPNNMIKYYIFELKEHKIYNISDEVV